MKRFTDTEKWRDPWYRELPPRLKCLWQYFCDTCDHAGVFQIDWKLASFEIGERVTERDLDSFSDRLQLLPSGRYLIKKYIKFQSGSVTESCPAHKPILKLIQQHGLVETSIDYQYPIARVSGTIEYCYPIGYPSTRVQEIEKRKEKEIKEGGVGETMKIPPEPTEAISYGKSIEMQEDDINAFMDHHTANGWRLKAGKMKDWRAALRTWKRNGEKFNGNGHSRGNQLLLAPVNGAQLISWNQELGRVISKMDKIVGQYGDHQSWDQRDKTRFKELADRKKELKELIGAKE